MTDRQEMPEAPAQVADAPKDNWVDRFAPARAIPYLRLSRADRPIGTWLLYIPCLWGVALAAMGDGFRLWDLWIALSCGIGAFLMRGAGCTWNDITDRDFDGQVARTRSRPIPSGQVTVKQALVWMAVQALVAANPHGSRTLFAEAFQDNPGSAKVLTNSGFSYLGDAESWSVARNARVPTWTYLRKMA